MPAADATSAGPLLAFAAASLAACGAYAFGVRPFRSCAQRGHADADAEVHVEGSHTRQELETPAAHEDQSPLPTGAAAAHSAVRSLPWMLALPGAWLIALWAAEARSLSARGVVAGMLVGMLIGAACVGLGRRPDGD